jgi:hypothetical protein
VRHDHRLHATQRASQPVRTSQLDLPPSYQFAPASIEVAPGITITWTNHDNFTHSVRVEGQSSLTLKVFDRLTAVLCHGHCTSRYGARTVVTQLILRSLSSAFARGARYAISLGRSIEMRSIGSPVYVHSSTTTSVSDGWLNVFSRRSAPIARVS